MRFSGIFLALSALMSAQVANAETLNFRGFLPASIDLPSDVETIETEPLGGGDGHDLELALSDSLGGVQIDGQTWFRVFSSRSQLGAGNAPDAILRGSVSRNVETREISTRDEFKCKKFNEIGICTQPKIDKIWCREFKVTLNPRIILSTLDGRQLYSHTTPASTVQNYCKGEAWPSENNLVRATIGKIVGDVRSDLAPLDLVFSVRVMEDRDGLKGDVRSAFKTAIKRTKSDQDAACYEFGELYRTQPSQGSVIFNHGLCVERAGDLEGAAEIYREALQLDPDLDYPKEGLFRLAARHKANAQVELGLSRLREDSTPEG